jgi:hypothetical protein
MKESPRWGLFSLAYIYYKNLKSKSQMFFFAFSNISQNHMAEKGFAKPSRIAISWIHVPMASKLGAPPLRQSRHDGTFHLME